ncbi:MAG: alpha-hydroxy-acid oxidizing protein [Balneola sp.]
MECLKQISTLQWERSFGLIASGGIRSAHDIAKAFCLGATFAATAQPIIKSISESGLEGIQILFDQWKNDFKIILTLLGCTSVSELNASHLLDKTA